MTSAESFHVPTVDGVELKAYRSGRGPALLFVHGGLSVSGSFSRVIARLAGSYTCICYDRRGYGESLDRGDTSFEREYRDLLDIIDWIDRDVVVIGHSSGGICALGAAQSSKRIKTLIIQEPPLRVVEAIAPPACLSNMRAAVERNATSEALRIGLREIVKYSPTEMADVERSKQWPALAGRVKRWLRELEEIDSVRIESFRAIEVPTLLLVGTKTARHHFDAVEALRQTLPHGEVATMKGQGHLALATSPDLFAGQCDDFIRRQSVDSRQLSTMRLAVSDR